jgi:hypothetical protein
LNITLIISVNLSKTVNELTTTNTHLLLVVPYQEPEKRMNGFWALDSVLLILQVAKLALCGDVVAQLPATCFNGEIRHSNTRDQHHRYENQDGCRLVAGVYHTNSHKGAQNPTKASNRACKPDASRPDCSWVYLQGTSHKATSFTNTTTRDRSKDLSKPQGHRCAG